MQDPAAGYAPPPTWLLCKDCHVQVCNFGTENLASATAQSYKWFEGLPALNKVSYLQPFGHSALALAHAQAAGFKGERIVT